VNAPPYELYKMSGNPLGPAPLPSTISHGFDLSALSPEQQHLLYAEQAQIPNGHQLAPGSAAGSTGPQLSMMQANEARTGTTSDPMVLINTP
jgi:hypothetical protein